MTSTHTVREIETAMDLAFDHRYQEARVILDRADITATALADYLEAEHQDDSEMLASRLGDAIRTFAVGGEK